MCGLAGIFGYSINAPAVDRHELLAMQEHMINRGRDGAGLWLSVDNQIGFAHRRLSIIDLSSAAAQPMASSDGLLQIVFNGAIYNYRVLRTELELRGHTFRTQSDTEVLLALYMEYGSDMVMHLRGMFAFAIWDKRQHRLLLARDPFGIKPLYYSDDGQTLRFASQVKTIVKGDAVRLTPDPAGHAGYFIFGHVPEPHTLYRQIRSLPPGSFMIVERHKASRVYSYYDLAEQFEKASAVEVNLSDTDLGEMVSAAVKNSVLSHLVSDVPVGVFLSAGVYSKTIAAHASTPSDAPISSLTVGFDEFSGTSSDEVPLAEAHARLFKLNHTTRRFAREEFFELLPSIWEAMDQPSTDGVSSWLLAKAASEQGLKVCLSGLGGNELFDEYPGFMQRTAAVTARDSYPFTKTADLAIRRAFSFLPERWISPKYAGMFRYGTSLPGASLLRRALFMPKEIQRFLDPDLLKDGLAELDNSSRLANTIGSKANPHARLIALEQNWYRRSQLLRDTDWASMAHGVEVRVPLVDISLFQALLPSLVSASPPNKATLAASVGETLAEEIKQRPKTGISTPVCEWLSDRYSLSGSYRGLRGWSRVVYSRFVPELSLESPDPIPPRLKSRHPVLIYRIGQLGDTLISLPAIKAIRDQFPEDEIILLTDRHLEGNTMVSAWEVLGPTQLLNGVIYYPVVRGKVRNLWIYLRLALSLRKLKLKHVVNLAPRVSSLENSRDKLFFRFMCGVESYSFLKASGKLHHVNCVSERQKPEWLRLLNLVSPGAQQWTYQIALPHWARAEAQTAIADIRMSGCELIGIGPGSKMPAKRWPEERFEVLGRRLLEKNPNVFLLIFGGTEDRDVGERLSHAWGSRAKNVAGKLSIFGSAALLHQCKLYVGNDTGTMHLAALMGTPCVAIFSARDERGKWDPVGANNHILRKDVGCAGCMLEVCVEHKSKCLTDIKVEDVLEVIN